MCDTCGCGQTDNDVTISMPGTHKHTHIHNGHSHEHSHDHDHHHHDEHDHEHHHDHGRIIQVEQDILKKNDLIAERNRGYFQAKKILTFNLVSCLLYTSDAADE